MFLKSPIISSWQCADSDVDPTLRNWDSVEQLQCAVFYCFCDQFTAPETAGNEHNNIMSLIVPCKCACAARPWVKGQPSSCASPQVTLFMTHKLWHTSCARPRKKAALKKKVRISKLAAGKTFNWVTMLLQVYPPLQSLSPFLCLNHLNHDANSKTINLSPCLT